MTTVRVTAKQNRRASPQASEGELILAALPYLLLLVFLLSAWPLAWLFGEQTAYGLWTIARWLVRLVLLIGTPMLWWTHRPVRLPQGEDAPLPRLWPYSWLAFAAYEVVALLLTFSIFLIDELSRWGTLSLLVGFGLALLAVVPYAAVAIGLGRRDAQFASYAFFPLAALAGELFYLGLFQQLGTRFEWEILVATIPPLVATAVIHLFVFPLALSRNQRWWVLYGGAGVVQLTFAVGFAWQDRVLWFLLFAIPLSILAFVILVSPVILSGIWNLALLLLARLGETAVGQQLRQQLAPSHRVWALRTLVTDQLFTVFGGRIMGTSMHEEHSMAEQPVEQTASGSSVSTSAGMGRGAGEPPITPSPHQPVGRGVERLYKLAVVLLAAMIVVGVVLFVGRAAVYKIHEYERGLHLRGGRFMAIQEPGWHVQIPLVDTVIIVKINERLGYVEQIPAMTSDNVTMIVSLQYTYRVIEPQQYALQVDDPERIVFEFVQGKLRDVVNTKAMADVMNDRALMNQQVMEVLKEKEEQYGVRFVTVQMQSASPPEEVLSAIKDRMVAVQRQEQAQAEAAQQRTIAEAELYSAQKRADAQAYEITRTAEAEAERIRLTTEAQQLSIRSVIDELDGKGELANKFLDYLIAQELRENSKWIIHGEGTPLVNVQE